MISWGSAFLRLLFSFLAGVANADPAIAVFFNGIVSYEGRTDYLCEELARIIELRRNNRHVRFFLEKNPGYRRGDELSCLTDLAVSNIKPMALKMISRSHATWITDNSE